MAVVWTRLDIEEEWGDDDKAKQTGRRVYLVLCDDKLDGTDVAAAGCPAPGAAWSVGKPGLVVTKRTAVRKDVTGDGGATHSVTCEYSTTDNDPDQNKPPLQRPPVVRLSFDSFEETAYRAIDKPTAEDADGANVDIAASWKWKKAVVNSAGKPFDPSITDCYRDPVVTVSKNMSALPWDHVTDYVDTVNSDSFDLTYRGNTYTIDAGTAWLFDISSESKYENGAAYEEVTYVIKIRSDGWARKILDQGLEQLDNGDTPCKWIRDKDGNPIQTPELLDGKGAKLAAGAKPVFLKFKFKEEQAFGDMNLDEPEDTGG